jgi:hypothetical protein
MLRSRRLVVLPICGLAAALACSARSKASGATDPGDSACDCGVEGGDDASEAAGDAGAAVQSPDGSASVASAASWIGMWTLVGTEQGICGATTSDSFPESMTMTVRPGADAADSTEAGSATDSSGTYLVFDAGLGCSLTVSFTNGSATLVPEPQRCGVEGKPIDRVFTSVQIAPASQFAGWLRLEETYTDQSGCTFLVQGYLLPLTP